MKRVLIIQRSIPHYRVSFFIELQRQLEAAGIALRLVYSIDAGANDPFNDANAYPWATLVKRASLELGSRRLSLQFISPLSLRKFDMIIFEQANENLFNFTTFLFRASYKYKIAFWGHGKNRQSKSKISFSETFKRLSLGWADWWFAYTNETTRYLICRGIPATKISTVNNSIDTSRFIIDLSTISQASIAQKKAELGINSNNIALFCGSMYAQRGLDFLLAAADQIRSQIPDFHLLVAGSGSEAHIVEDARKTRGWLHYLGPVYDHEKALAFSMSKIILMPGIVGLIVIDALVSGLPLITTRSDQHGPEIDYIEHGVNGFVTEPELSDFVDQAIKLLVDEPLLTTLKSNCIQSSRAFSTQVMARNFVIGITTCLSQK